MSALSRLWAWLLEEVPQDGGRTLPFRFLRRAVQPYAFAISI